MLLRPWTLLSLLVGGAACLPAAVLYNVTDLGSLGVNQAYAINNAGQVTGMAYTASGIFYSFLYSNGVMTDLGTLPGATSSYSYGAAINNAGQITGYSATGSAIHAFLYSNGVMADLGTLPGATSSQGSGINDAGQITGSSGGHAFLYSNGVMVDLNDLIDPTLHITLRDAGGINNFGQIVANGSGHAYLLTPVPEPGTWALFGAGLLFIVVLTQFYGR